ncbi:hypothetical protein Y600_5980 [Burkholderia pseudomallei MSHR3709]|nr:hypothetical protein Y600_5980 [Burkholderia pseudomallei MSHR3709]
MRESAPADLLENFGGPGRAPRFHHASESWSERAQDAFQVVVIEQAPPIGADHNSHLGVRRHDVSKHWQPGKKTRVGHESACVVERGGVHRMEHTVKIEKERANVSHGISNGFFLRRDIRYRYSSVTSRTVVTPFLARQLFHA